MARPTPVLHPGDVCIADMPSGPVVARFVGLASGEITVDVAGALTRARDAYPYSDRLSQACVHRQVRRAR